MISSVAYVIKWLHLDHSPVNDFIEASFSVNKFSQDDTQTKIEDMNLLEISLLILCNWGSTQAQNIHLWHDLEQILCCSYGFILHPSK